jgi:hypothetical protein
MTKRAERLAEFLTNAGWEVYADIGHVCSKCGHEDSWANYCSNCGTKMPKDEKTTEDESLVFLENAIKYALGEIKIIVKADPKSSKLDQSRPDHLWFYGSVTETLEEALSGYFDKWTFNEGGYSSYAEAYDVAQLDYPPEKFEKFEVFEVSRRKYNKLKKEFDKGVK